MKRGAKVKIIAEDNEYYGRVGVLEEQNVESLPICSVYFDDDDFDYFSEDEIEKIV